MHMMQSGHVADAEKDLKDRLSGRLGADKLEERMDLLRRETGNLLDERALLALIADEQGLTETPLSTLEQLDLSRPVFTRCRVEQIEKPREFQGRDRAGKLRKLVVADETGSRVLTLWDEETGVVEQLGLRSGSRIRILGAELRSTRYGLEISVGRAGFIVSDEEPEVEGPSEKRDIQDIGKEPFRVDVKGVILALSTTGRGRQKVTTIRLFDGTGECELVVPHEMVALPPELAMGVEVDVHNALAEKCNGRTVLCCDRRSSIRTG